MNAYIASPLGFSEAGRHYYHGILIPTLRESSLNIVDPWQLTPQHLIQSAASLPTGPERIERWREVNAMIARNNAEAIRQCDILIAILDGTDVDSGTAAEVGYAFALNKKIFGYRGDFRLSADNEGSIVNLQVEYFILASGGTIHRSLAELTQALRTL